MCFAMGRKKVRDVVRRLGVAAGGTPALHYHGSGRHGNLLESSAEALVNAVNCVGVMGKGIALQSKQQFPDNYRAYRTALNRKNMVDVPFV